jgi:putative transposase
LATWLKTPCFTLTEFDRYIRDKRHFANAVRYIHENPVKAALAEKPEDWP